MVTYEQNVTTRGPSWSRLTGRPNRSKAARPTIHALALKALMLLEEPDVLREESRDESTQLTRIASDPRVVNRLAHSRGRRYHLWDIAKHFAQNGRALQAQWR